MSGGVRSTGSAVLPSHRSSAVVRAALPMPCSCPPAQVPPMRCPAVVVARPPCRSARRAAPDLDESRCMSRIARRAAHLAHLHRARAPRAPPRAALRAHAAHDAAGSSTDTATVFVLPSFCCGLWIYRAVADGYTCTHWRARAFAPFACARRTAARYRASRAAAYAARHHRACRFAPRTHRCTPHPPTGAHARPAARPPPYHHPVPGCCLPVPAHRAPRRAALRLPATCPPISVHHHHRPAAYLPPAPVLQHVYATYLPAGRAATPCVRACLLRATRMPRLQQRPPPRAARYTPAACLPARRAFHRARVLPAMSRSMSRSFCA